MDARSYEEVHLSSETLPESAIAIACSAVLALVAIGLMTMRATIAWNHNRVLKWIPTVTYIVYIAVCTVSVGFQIRVLRSVVATASELHGSGVSEIVAARAIDVVQDQYRWWRTAEFLGSVLASVAGTILISTRMILSNSKASKRQDHLSPGHPPISHTQKRIVVLESWLPFTLIAIAGVLLKGRMQDVVWPPVGYLEEALLPSSDLNHLMHVLWAHSLALAVQVYLTGLALVRFRRLTVEHRQERRRYVYFLFVLLLLSMVRFGVSLAQNSWTPPTSSTFPATGAYPLSTHGDILTWVSTAALSLAGDAFLAWRASVVWDHHRVLKRVPCAVYAAYLGVCIASLVFKSLALRDLVSDTNSEAWGNIKLRTQAFERTAMLYRPWRIADFSMSVAVNVVSTTMIVARLLLTRKRVEKVCREVGVLKVGIPYRRVMRLVLESALPFTVVGVAGAITVGLMNSSSHYGRWLTHAFAFIVVFWSNALALGPQLIALRVISGVAWKSNATSRHTRPISQPLVFAGDSVVSLGASVTKNNEQGGLEAQRHTRPVC
ncbi:hypothetical protein BKA70DRAFT_1521256 [Coprinopsis sp. MPI-PUGE-AT-0042]|nr:hypothetical protein BKA70DRAFT_1521256 [Coprinopsis sp. MPI-PUGE-AT-0042]